MGKRERERGEKWLTKKADRGEVKHYRNNEMKTVTKKKSEALEDCVRGRLQKHRVEQVLEDSKGK